MNTILCKNIFISDNEEMRCQEFNRIWQNIVNLIVNR